MTAYVTSTTTWHHQQRRRRVWNGRDMELQKMRTWHTILSSLEKIWKWTWSVDSRNRITTCQRGSWRLLGKAFEMKSIKEGSKTPNWYLKANQALRNSNNGLQIHNCTYLLNSYVTCTVNNMDLTITLNKEKKD